MVNLTNATAVVGGAVSFTGVSQSTPFGIFRSAAGQTQKACVTLATAPAPLVVAVLGVNGNAVSTTPGSRQTPVWNTGTGTTGQDISAVGTTVPGTPTAAICETLAVASSWVLLTLPLNPAIAH